MPREQKPGWLRELEGPGGKAVELAATNDDAPALVKKVAKASRRFRSFERIAGALLVQPVRM